MSKNLNQIVRSILATITLAYNTASFAVDSKFAREIVGEQNPWTRISILLFRFASYIKTVGKTHKAHGIKKSSGFLIIIYLDTSNAEPIEPCHRWPLIRTKF